MSDKKQTHSEKMAKLDDVVGFTRRNYGGETGGQSQTGRLLDRQVLA